MNQPADNWLDQNLTRAEATAFLAFFGGARGNLTAFARGDTGEELVNFGKAECEWVPFRQTWQVKFPALGLTTFKEGERRPAQGMVPGSTFTEIEIRATDFGRAVREAFWRRVNAEPDKASPQRHTPVRRDWSKAERVGPTDEDYETLAGGGPKR